MEKEGESIQVGILLLRGVGEGLRQRLKMRGEPQGYGARGSEGYRCCERYEPIPTQSIGRGTDADQLRQQGLMQGVSAQRQIGKKNG